MPLFTHLPTKKSLREAVADRVAEQLFRRVFTVADQHEQAGQALEAMLLAHIGFIARHPGIPWLILGELQESVTFPAKRIIRQTLATYRHEVISLLNAGIDRKSISSTVDTKAASVLYLGVVEGLAIQGMADGGIESVEQSASRVFRPFAAGTQEVPHEPQE